MACSGKGSIKSRAILIDGGSDREEKRKKGGGTFKQLIVMSNSRLRNWAAVIFDMIMRTDFFVCLSSVLKGTAIVLLTSLVN